jgi:eight-cysteine-cluster-containing protein
MNRARVFGAALVGLAGALAFAGCEERGEGDGAPHGDAGGGGGERVGRSRGCPEGWSDAEAAQILCVEGTLPVTRTIGAEECVACLPETGPEDCRGDWVPQGVELACGPGEEAAASEDGFCKRCIQRKGGCTSDAGCLRGGCSGQLCAPRGEPVLTTCEWHDAYGCYAKPFAHCGCIEGTCAWEQTEELLACLGSKHPDR